MITLATLPQASAQEVFDQVARHLLTQMHPSMDEEEGVCTYRGSFEGTKCAAGALISDEEFETLIEPKGFVSKKWQKLVQEKIAPAKHQILIHELQRIHDYEDPIHWEHELRVLAKNRHLQFKDYS
jgi:hypothetical protein